METLKLSEAKKIFTDRLKNYRYLIDEKLHSVKRFITNHIERKNLTLRTNLERLNRRTLLQQKFTGFYGCFKDLLLDLSKK